MFLSSDAPSTVPKTKKTKATPGFGIFRVKKENDIVKIASNAKLFRSAFEASIDDKVDDDMYYEFIIMSDYNLPEGKCM